MFKKIMIGILVAIMLAGAAGTYTYRRIESQFESFILAEVERKRAEIENIIAEKLEEEALKAIAKKEEVVVDFMVEIADEDVPLGAVDMSTIALEEVETSDSSSAEINDEQQTSSHEEAPTEPSSQQITTPETTTADISTVESTPVEAVSENTQEEAVYTKEDFERDKKIAMDLALSRLTASQISRLIDISSGGFTSEEKQEAKEMFYSNFSTDEQDWILGIYSKYYSLVNED